MGWDQAHHLAGRARSRQASRGPFLLMSPGFPGVIGMDYRYIERILKARVYDVAIETPLEPARRL
jgi:hypothetical protein